MRPNASSNDAELYECFECGARQKQPRSRECERCGGELKNISRSRDL